VRGWMAAMVAALASFMGAVSGAQEAIRVNVNLVTVAFSVRDANGGLVDNLTKEDFEVDEDTVPQKIAYFARSVDVPLTLGLIVDASGSQEHFLKKHQHDLEVFLKDVLGPKGRVFLVGFGNHIPGERFFAVGRGIDGGMEALRKGEPEISGTGAAGGTRPGDGVLRFDLLSGDGKAGHGKWQAGAADVQRWGGQFEFARHDDGDRGGPERECAGVRDPLYGKAAWKIDGAESVWDVGDGTGGERDRWSAYRCGGYGSAYVFSADLGRVADVV
jgi:hypothetical protein